MEATKKIIDPKTKKIIDLKKDIIKYAKHYGIERIQFTAYDDEKKMTVAIGYRNNERAFVPPALRRYLTFNNMFHEKKYLVFDLFNYNFEYLKEEIETFFLNRKQAAFFDDTKITFSGVEIINGFFHYKFNNAAMPYDRLYDMLHSGEVVLREVLNKAHKLNSILLKCKEPKTSDINISEEEYNRVLAKMEILLHSNIYLKAYFVNNDSIKEHFPFKGFINY